VGSHWPMGGGLLLRQISRALEHGTRVPEGHWPNEFEIMNVCGSLAWQALGAWSFRDCAGLRGGSLGERCPGGTVERAQGSEIPWPVKQRLRRPVGQKLVCSVNCSFSISWHGEAFHELGIQSTDVSALLCALPQPRVSPASQQSPWFT
jgi:hypothetical protein